MSLTLARHLTLPNVDAMWLMEGLHGQEVQGGGGELRSRSAAGASPHLPGWIKDSGLSLSSAPVS